MSKERSKQGRERAPSPALSLRDYWQHPTGTPFSSSSEPRRRSLSRPQVSTPSLWDTGTGESLIDRQSSVGQVNEPAALLSLPLEGEIVTENKQQLADRLELYGVSSLSNAELLSLILRTGAGNEASIRRVHELLAEYRVQELLAVDFGELSKQHGLGNAKAAQVQAVLEMARRLLLPSSTEKYQVRTAADVVRLVAPDMAFLDHEEMRGLYLDTKNYLVANVLLYKGTVNSSVLRNAEILRPAVTRNCPHLIVCHNHPSGDPAPSPEDLAVTQQLVEAGKLLDIELLDHLIIGHHHRFVSLKEQMRW